MKIHIQNPNRRSGGVLCGRFLSHHDVRLGSVIPWSPRAVDMERASCLTCLKIVDVTKRIEEGRV